MTPQGAVIAAVMVLLAVFGFVYDKRKADKIRSEVDRKFDGRHVCDFKDIYYSGYIADNTLLLKERVKGYLQIDLTKVKTISSNTVRINGVFMASVWFNDENGKAVGDCKKIKQMTPRAAEKLINLVLEHANWIERDSYFFPKKRK